MAEKFSPITWDMKIRSITKVERSKEDADIVVYKLMARDKDGVNEITITSGSPFKGLSAKDGIVQVSLTNSQMTIEDFKGEEEEKED